MKLDFDPRKNITTSDYVIMRLNRINQKINDLLTIHSMVKNWYDILLFRVGFKKPRFVMRLRNGKKIEIKKPEDYFSFWESEEGQQELLRQLNLNRQVKIIDKSNIIEFEFGNKLLRFRYDSQKQLDNILGLIKEQFIEEHYRWLDVKGKDVIDIGANVGDTAIYFASKGAKHVYAFEPYPYSYELAMRNIKLNELEDKITLLNEGCSGKENVIKIDTAYKNTGSTDLKIFSKGKRIKITTLESIVKRFNIGYPAILKIDCEGCEYGTLLATQNSDLKRFKQIQIEYHYGYLNIKRKLNSSKFKVTNTIPGYSNNLEAENKEMFLGMIYAERE